MGQEKYVELAWVVLEDFLMKGLNGIKYCDPPFPDDAIITGVEVDNNMKSIKVFIRSKEYINVFSNIPRLDVICYRRREDWLKQPRVQKWLKAQKEKKKIKVTLW